MKIVELPEEPAEVVPRVEVVDLGDEGEIAKNVKLAERAAIAALPVRVIAITGMREQMDILDPANHNSNLLLEAIQAGYRVSHTEQFGSGSFCKALIFLDRRPAGDLKFTEYTSPIQEK